MQAFLTIFALLSTAAVFGEAVVVCYWGAWANSRTGIGRYGVSDMPLQLCTHIVYSFVGLTAEGEITFLNDQNELEGKSNTIEEFLGLKTKNSDLKLILAAGGWNEGSTNFTIVANNATLREKYATNVVNYVVENGFDGFDLDWEYPNQRGGVESDREAFVYLLQELKTKLAAANSKLILSVAVGVTQNNVDLSYLVSNISATVDYINLMTYDFHGSWDTVTGVNSPLYPQLTDASTDVLNVNASVNVWINEGADPAKLVLGMGAYGRTFTLTSTDKDSLATGAPATGAGVAGPYTAEAGIWAFYEICTSQINETNWNITEVSRNYAYGNLDNFWVGYDNVNTIAAKATYAKNLGLGGVFFWSMDQDDFSGLCNGGTYPLIRAAKSAFEGIDASDLN